MTTDLKERMLATFGVPAHLLGSPPPPETIEEAARLRLQHWMAIGCWPEGDEEIDRIIVADHLRSIAFALDPGSRERARMEFLAHEYLAPLQGAPA